MLILNLDGIAFLESDKTCIYIPSKKRLYCLLTEGGQCNPKIRKRPRFFVMTCNWETHLLQVRSLMFENFS